MKKCPKPAEPAYYVPCLSVNLNLCQTPEIKPYDIPNYLKKCYFFLQVKKVTKNKTIIPGLSGLLCRINTIIIKQNRFLHIFALLMKILIIQTAFIGDVVLATPLIEALKEKNPYSCIDFLVRKGNESLLSNNPKINKVLVFDKKKHKYRNMFRLIKKIRSQSYDYVVNAQRFFATGLITAFSGAKVKTGFKKNPLSFTFTHKIPHKITKTGSIHEAERNLALLEPFAGKVFKKPVLYLSSQDEQVVPYDYEYICIAPASIWLTKQFPFNKWRELINNLPQQYKIYLIGSADDIALCEKIQQGYDTSRVIISAGQHTLLQSVALIKHAKMTFTNDSAPMHLASAINAPVTAVFCSTVPEFGFGPLSSVSYVFETDIPLSCRPCGLHGKKACPKGHFKCSHISIDKMLKEINIG
jgi:heptosyltransferase-2